MIDCVLIIWKLIKEAIIIFLIQHFEADFLWKVRLKILNSGLILKTFTYALEFVKHPECQIYLFHFSKGHNSNNM